MSRAPALSAMREASFGTFPNSSGATRVYVWGWGRLTQADDPFTSLNPTLVEAMESASLRRLCSSHRHTVATTCTCCVRKRE